MKNPLEIDKGRVQDLPDAGGPGGGSDQQLGRAADAWTEADEDQNPYTPPMPVPIQRLVQRDYTLNRGLRSSVWLAKATTGKSLPTFGTLNTGDLANAGEDFPINTIMVDNFTGLWLSWPEVGKWIPPFVFGVVFRFDGGRQKRVLFEQPPQVTVTSPTSVTGNQFASVRFFEELLEEKPGISLPSTDR